MGKLCLAKWWYSIERFLAFIYCFNILLLSFTCLNFWKFANSHDCRPTCHHPTIRERNWNFWVSWEVLSKYGDLSIANVARLGSLKAFFRSLAKNYLYVVICHFDGTYNHLIYFEKNRSMRSEPKEMALEFDSITPLLRVWVDFLSEILLNEVTLAKLTWCMVTCTADCICHHPPIRERNWNFLVSCEVLSKYWDLAITKVARPVA